VRSFASDNASGVHPKVMDALAAANVDVPVAACVASPRPIGYRNK